MKWIKSHKIITILICAIIVLLIIIGASFASGGSSNAVGRTVQTVVSAIEKPFSKVTNGIKDGFRGIFQFKEVVAENEELKEKLEKAEQTNTKLALEKDQYDELKELEKAFSFDAVENAELVGANIVSVDSSNWMGVFTIDKGTESGIAKDKIVINGSGLVGKVTDCGKNWSKVVSVLDESNKISFRVSRDKKLTGIAEGDGGDGMSGYMLDGKAGVIEGDLIITSGIGMYPQGLELGKVKKVEYNKDTQYKEIEIQPSVSFKSLKKVAVIL